MRAVAQHYPAIVSFAKVVLLVPDSKIRCCSTPSFLVRSKVDHSKVEVVMAWSTSSPANCPQKLKFILGCCWCVAGVVVVVVVVVVIVFVFGESEPL